LKGNTTLIVFAVAQAAAVETFHAGQQRPIDEFGKSMEIDKPATSVLTTTGPSTRNQVSSETTIPSTPGLSASRLPTQNSGNNESNGNKPVKEVPPTTQKYTTQNGNSAKDSTSNQVSVHR
jgi:hypothetical protein